MKTKWLNTYDLEEGKSPFKELYNGQIVSLTKEQIESLDLEDCNIRVVGCNINLRLKEKHKHFNRYIVLREVV